MRSNASTVRWLLFAGVLLLAPLGVVAAGNHADGNRSEGPDDGAPGSEHRGSRANASGDARGPDGGDDEGAGDRGRRLDEAGAREGRRVLGSLRADGDVVTGRVFSFRIEEELPGITELAIDGQAVALGIALPAADDGEHSMAGALFRYESGGARLEVLNTPNALLFVDVDDDASVLVTLAPGLVPQPVPTRHDEDEDGDADVDGGAADGEDENGPEDGPIARWNLTLDNGTLGLVGRNVTVAGNVVTVGDRLMMRLVGPVRVGHDGPDGAYGTMGRANAHELREDVRARVEEAIAAGDVAVEVFADADAPPVSFEMGHVRVRGANAHGSGAVRAELDIEAPDGSPGAVVVLNLDAEDLGNLTAEEAAEALSVSANGETLEPADDMPDVLRWDDDEAPEYLLFIGKDDAKLVLSLPHFSPFTIQVIDTQSAGGAASDTPMAGLVVLLGALGVAAVARRRRT